MTQKNTKRIRLNISGAKGVEYLAWPVTFGIPFADGELQRGSAVRVVDGAGQAIPIQTTCLATWNKDLEYVRWLLLDMQADLAPGQTRSFFLEYGADQASPESEQPVRVERRGDHLVVDTGPMKLEIRTSFVPWKQPHHPDVFARCLLQSDDGWRDLFRGHPGPFLYMREICSSVSRLCAAMRT